MVDCGLAGCRLTELVGSHLFGRLAWPARSIWRLARTAAHYLGQPGGAGFLTCWAGSILGENVGIILNISIYVHIYKQGYLNICIYNTYMGMEMGTDMGMYTYIFSLSECIYYIALHI